MADYAIKVAELRTENESLQARIAELEADALVRLIEEPTNERIMKDVYEENERLQKAVEEAREAIRIHNITQPTHSDLQAWLKEHGKELK